MLDRASRTPTPRPSAGFSLLEVTCASVVLALGLFGAAAAQSSGLKLAREARVLSAGAADLAAAVEMVQSTPFDQLTTRFPGGQAIASFHGLHLPGEDVVVSYPSPGTDPL